MSHVIPLWLFQVLKSDRWNCNVFWGAKKSEGAQITCDFWRGRGRGEAGTGPGAGLRWGEAWARLGGGSVSTAGTWWPGLMRWLPQNVARNSPVAISSFEMGSLELQRFLGS